MGRLLVLVLLVVAVVWLIRRAFRAPKENEESRENEESLKNAETLVRCTRCGVLLPRGEARSAGGALYCTEDHARLGPGGG